MQDLIKHEQFEIEILEKLHNAKILQSLVFTGGTMLRLCYGLDRYSRDLDFWMLKKVDYHIFFEKIKQILSIEYRIKDTQNKYFSMVFEFASTKYPSAIKIEIRKESKKVKVEKNIAYTPNANIQVLLNTVSLEDMMSAKISAFLERSEIRDIYDIEFMLKKGVKPQIDKNRALLIEKKIEKFMKNDYKVKLGSLLNAEKREYYNKANFRILRDYLREIVGQVSES